MVKGLQGVLTPQNNGPLRQTHFGVRPIGYIVRKLGHCLLFPTVTDKKLYQLIHAAQKQQNDSTVDKPPHLSQLIPQIDLRQKFPLPQGYQQADNSKRC